MNQTKYLLGCSLILLVILTVLSCNEAPFEPPPNGPEGYGVYFHSEENPARWYIYYPQSDYLDSVMLPTPIGYRGAISPSGDRLYLSRALGEGVLVVDLQTGRLVIELPYGVQELSVHPSGNYLAIDPWGFTLISADDFSILFIDTTTLFEGVNFSSDGNHLVGTLISPDYRHTYGEALLSKPGDVSPIPIISSNGHTMVGGRVLTSPQSAHWYLMAFAGHQRYFIDWDKKTDSIIFADTTVNEIRNFTHHITRDGKYVTYKNGGFVAWAPQDRPNEFRVYDTELKQVVDTVDTRIFNASGDTTYFNVDEMALTPDSKWLVGITHGVSSHLVVYSLETLKIERFREIPGDHRFAMILCQTGE